MKNKQIFAGFGLGIMFLVGYGIYVYDQNSKDKLEQDYRLSRMSECRSLGEKEEEKRTELDDIYFFHNVKYVYSEKDDTCASELIITNRGSKSTFINYHISDLFNGEALASFGAETSGKSNDFKETCDAYSDLRFKYFKDTLTECSSLPTYDEWESTN